MSQPDRPRGRGRRVHAVAGRRSAALRRGLPLLRPERVGDARGGRRAARAAPDLGVVVAFGQFLPRQVRELPRLGYLVNAHASVLPRHRGAAPIARAILAGDARDRHLGDARRARDGRGRGGARAHARDRRPTRTRASSASGCRALAADAIAEALAQIAGGSVRWREQDARARDARAEDRARDELAIDWREPAAAIARRVRALAPRPARARRCAASRCASSPRAPSRATRPRAGHAPRASGRAAAHRDRRRLARAAAAPARGRQRARRRRPTCAGGRSPTARGSRSADRAASASSPPLADAMGSDDRRQPHAAGRPRPRRGRRERGGADRTRTHRPARGCSRCACSSA